MTRRSPFIESTQSILPYLRGRSLAGFLLTVSHFIFAFHFGLDAFRPGPHRQCADVFESDGT